VLSNGGKLNQPERPDDDGTGTTTCSTNEISVDVNLIATLVREVVADMSLGACAETITQTVQILDLGNGKKAALSITVTTDHESYM
jgi:hypothetical protein